MTKALVLRIAIIFTFCAGGFLIYKSLTLKPQRVEVQSILNPITGETIKIDTFTDKYGTTHSTFKSDESNTISLKDLKKDDERALLFIDTVADVVARANQLLTVYKLKFRLQSDSIQALKIANSERVAYIDKYLSLGYTPSKDTANAGVFDIAYDNTLTITDYIKRAKVLGVGLGKKVSYTDISSEDSRASVNGLKKIQIKKQVPFFGLRGQALTRYNFGTNTFGAGVGLRLDLGKVSIMGSYVYIPTIRRITPSASISYDLFRF